MNVITKPETLSPKDFASDQDVRWCPGCGDYAILKSVQKTMPDLGVPKEKIVFVSGIGCAARFPYYMSTYGFHTIHGRAPAVATGLKLANPDLSVWVVSGDGDALSIGGNHLLHLVRRNVNVQFLLFNNEVYGLTKGQYSPTSGRGFRSPSTPRGSVDRPVSAGLFALGAGARFIARSYDVQQKVLPDVLLRAAQHEGTSFVEILQNCIVYNDGAFGEFTEKKSVPQTQIQVEDGQPLLFDGGKKGLRLDPKTLTLEVVTLGEGGVTEEDILVHDEKNRLLASLLIEMDAPHFPVAMGVLYCDPAAAYEGEVRSGVSFPAWGEARTKLNALLRKGSTWEEK